MSVTNAYALPLNLRIPTGAPIGLPPATQQAFDEIYMALNNIAGAFVSLTGASSYDPRQWDTIAGNPNTILASNANRFYAIASEQINWGELVCVVASGATPQMKKAVAGGAIIYPCDGFCNTITGVAAGEVGEFIIGHGLLPASGLLVGGRYFLSTTPGFMANGPATGVGQIEQYLGVALDVNHLYFNAGYWIVH